MILLKLCDKSLWQNCNIGWVYLNLIFKTRLLAPAQLKFLDSFVITTCLFKKCVLVLISLHNYCFFSL